MNSSMSPAMSFAPCAILHSKCGLLCIYDVDVICRIVASLPEVVMKPTDGFHSWSPAKDNQSLEGFTISEWASYEHRFIGMP